MWKRNYWLGEAIVMREHWTTPRFFAKAASFLWIGLLLMSGAGWGQTATYHLHAAPSSTLGQFQLQAAGPSTGTVSFMSGPLVVSGHYLIAAFDTQAGAPNTLGYIPTGSQMTMSLWMQASNSSGLIYPEAKVNVNSLSDTLLCSA